jgi:hypothetical protein
MAQQPNKYRNYTEDAGARLLVAGGTLTGVSPTAVASIESEWPKDRTMSSRGGPTSINQQTNVIGFPAHPRGLLDKVTVVQLAGSATTFEVWVVDRWQEECYLPNLVWRSSAVQVMSGTVPTYYDAGPGGYSYYSFASANSNVIHAYGILSAYENRATFDHDESELYLVVKPNTGSDNNFHVTVATLALT